MIRNFTVPVFDHDRVSKLSGRKCNRMVESVDGLGCICAEHSGRSMTIIAPGIVRVTASEITVVLVLHNVAVHAGRAVIA